MHFYSIKNIVTKIFFIMFFAMLMLSLVGFRDFAGEISKQGVKYKFQGRILEKVTSKEGQGLVVEKRPTVERTRATARSEEGKGDKGGRIYVIVTGETKIGYTVDGFRKKYIGFDDLKIGMSVMIEGIKSVQKADGQDIVVVLAKDIEPVE
jgi:hypothetical protein